MSTKEKQILRSLLDNSLITNKILNLYINGKVYFALHGRFDSIKTKESMITNREILFAKSLEVYM